jgi:hypothetical protein
MRHILKPNPAKVITTLILVILTSLPPRWFLTWLTSETLRFGFPFHFYLTWSYCPAGQICSEFHGLYLVFDIAICYVICALILERQQGSKKTG